MGHGNARNNKWQVLGIVGGSTFIIALNGTMLTVALPSIADYFQSRMGVVEWVLLSYLLATSTLLLIFGRLGDVYGFRRIYLLGSVIFTVSAALCELAPSVYVLVAGRTLQGIGAAMVMAIGTPILTATFPARERGKALGFLGAFVAAALGLGPVLGGMLLQGGNWRLLFHVTALLGALATVWAALGIVPTPGRPRRVDLPGTTVLFCGMGAFLLTLSHGAEWGWGPRAGGGLLAAAGLFLAFFVRLELTCPEPMMELRLFRNRLFAASTASAVLNFAVQYVALFLLPFYLKEVLGFDPARTGLVLSAFPLVNLLASPASGILSDYIGSRGLSALGMALSATALLMLAQVTPYSTWADVAAPLMLLGAGSGIFQSPSSSALMGSVPRTHLGMAGGMLATARNVGMVLGIALAGAVFNHRWPVHLAILSVARMDPAVTAAAAFAAAVRDAMLVGAALGAAGSLTSLVRGGARGSELRAKRR